MKLFECDLVRHTKGVFLRGFRRPSVRSQLRREIPLLENIERMIRKVFSLSVPFNLLIVDDGSPDGTSYIVKNLMQEFPGRLFIEERKGKLGLGTAYIEGFKWAISHQYDYIFEMDCDFSHNPNDLMHLLETLVDGADVSVGSRYVKGGKIKNWPRDRSRSTRLEVRTRQTHLV